MALKGSQRKYLRGLAHALKPIVFIGQKGLTPAVIDALEEALLAHELVKAKFVDDKDKAFKSQTLEALEKATHSQMVGMIGHIAIFYRAHPEPEKRKVVVPND